MYLSIKQQQHMAVGQINDYMYFIAYITMTISMVYFNKDMTKTSLNSKTHLSTFLTPCHSEKQETRYSFKDLTK